MSHLANISHVVANLGFLKQTASSYSSDKNNRECERETGCNSSE